jgi:hypothetical protein
MINRFQIIENIVETLWLIIKGDTITSRITGQTYTFKRTPRIVSNDFEMWDAAGEFPSFFVNSSIASFDGKPSRRYRMTWDIQIVAYALNNNELEPEISDMIDDIVMVMHNDITRGGLVTQTILTGIDVETRMIKPYGFAELTFQVTKHFDV